MLPSKRSVKFFLIFFLASQFFNLSLLFPKKLDSANLTSVKDTLDDNRLSFVSALASGNTEGTSLITINTDLSSYGWATSDENFNLFPGDALMVGTRTATYSVDDIIDDATDDKIQLNTVLLSGDADAGDPVIATRSAIHTVSMTTVTAVDGGAFRLRVAAGDANGIPDPGGFDFSTATWAVGDQACSEDGGTYNWGMETATASGQTGCTSGSYHCFECRYDGVGGVGNVITFTIGSTAKLINPAPSAETKSIGVSDNFAIIAEQLNSSNTVVDTTTIKVSLVEAVRVTATVEPILEFTIAAGTVDAGTRCGVSRTGTSIDTTASTVPLGTLSISAFIDAYQELSVSTNAAGGYAVTIQEDDQLSIGGDGSTILADSGGDPGTMTHTTKADWDDPSDADGKGFGYSLENVDCTSNCSLPFEYDQTDGACSGSTYCAKQFPELPSPDTAQSIFGSTGVADDEDIYLCYRVVIAATQAAGDYENRVTLIATATF